MVWNGKERREARRTGIDKIDELEPVFVDVLVLDLDD